MGSGRTLLRLPPRNANRGFSLIEVMVAAGVGMIIMLALAEMMRFTANSTKTTQVTQDWIAFQNQVYQIFNANNPNSYQQIANPMIVALGASGVNIDPGQNVSEATAVSITSLSYPGAAPSGASATMIPLATSGLATNGLLMGKILAWATSGVMSVQGPLAGNYYEVFQIELEFYGGLANYLIPGMPPGTVPGPGMNQTLKTFHVNFNVLTGPVTASGGQIPGQTVLQGVSN